MGFMKPNQVLFTVSVSVSVSVMTVGNKASEQKHVNCATIIITVIITSWWPINMMCVGGIVTRVVDLTLWLIKNRKIEINGAIT